jgi:hypothetical protein
VQVVERRSCILVIDVELFRYVAERLKSQLIDHGSCYSIDRSVGAVYSCYVAAVGVSFYKDFDSIGMNENVRLGHLSY